MLFFLASLNVTPLEWAILHKVEGGGKGGREGEEKGGEKGGERGRILFILK